MTADGWDDGLSSWYAVAVRHDGDHRVSAWIPVRADLLDGAGALRLGALAFAADCAVGISAGWAALPDWVVTTDLDLRYFGPVVAGPVRACAVPIRRGRGQVLVEVTLCDEGAGDALVATGTANHAVLPPDLGAPLAVLPVGSTHRQPSSAGEHPPALHEHFGAVSLGDGMAELDMSARTRNPWGIMHGSLHVLLAEVAAASLVPVTAARVAAVTTRFAAPVRVGPARAIARVAGRRGHDVVVRVEVRDTGSNDRLGSLTLLTVSGTGGEPPR